MVRVSGLVFATWCSVASATTQEADVIIVGAGISGLWSARELHKNSNLSVIVLEGRDRVGGRTESVNPGTNDSYDYGAHWVGKTQYHILEVMKQLGKTRYRQYVTGTKVMEVDGKVSHYHSDIPTLPLMQEINFGLFYLKAGSTLNHIPRDAPYNYSNAEHYDGMTVESFCNGFPWKKEVGELVASSARTIFGKELSDVSALAFLHYAACAGGITPLLDAAPGGGQEFKIVGGTQSLSIEIAKAVDVRFNSTVVAIDAGDESQGSMTSVRTLDGRTFKAKRVIVAVPPHIAAGMWYTPVLPANKAHLLTHMTQGHLIKTIISYDRAFWRINGFSGEVVSASFPLSICYDDTTPAGTAALVCFVGGRDAKRLSPVSKEERQAQVVEALVRYFGDEAKEVKEYRERDWGLEPFTGGCPAGSMNAGVITQWGPTLREPHGPVHFGGTETATWWYGFMNGAVQAGERCAIEVMEALGLTAPKTMYDFYNMGGVNKSNDRTIQVFT